MDIVETDRTVIGRISLDDAPFFVSLMNTPEWIRFIGDRNIASVADARRYLEEGLLKCGQERGFSYYLVRLKPDFEPIGVCGFLKKPNLANPDFGFAFLPEFCGQGLALESCRATFEFGISTFKFTTLDAVTDTENVRSMKLLEKLEFQRCGFVSNDRCEKPLALFRWQADSHADL